MNETLICRNCKIASTEVLREEGGWLTVTFHHPDLNEEDNETYCGWQCLKVVVS